MINKALIVKEHWGRLILNNEKPWEIRGMGTRIRGRVGIIFSGTGMIYGSAEIYNSSKLSKLDFIQHPEMHHIDRDYEDLPYTNPHIWHISNAIWFSNPIPYIHPQGAVIWVNLENSICSKLF